MNINVKDSEVQVHFRPDQSYGQLKQKQKEKISEWMYQTYRKQAAETLSDEVIQKARRFYPASLYYKIKGVR